MSVMVKWLKQYNLRQVQYLAGHRYISSTEAYQQNDMEGLSEESEQVPTIMIEELEITNCDLQFVMNIYKMITKSGSRKMRPPQ